MRKGIVMYNNHEPLSTEEKVNNIIGTPDENIRWRIVMLPDTKNQTK
ncbi:MAG: hypothetical protein FWC74_09485 [Candidatus Bathyarchaeota archaeon]|nr:hypothetical protein [Candidatus Termitimicrobium sp.]